MNINLAGTHANIRFLTISNSHFCKVEVMANNKMIMLMLELGSKHKFCLSVMLMDSVNLTGKERDLVFLFLCF